MQALTPFMLATILLLLAACGGTPRIEILHAPKAALGGATDMEEINGRAGGNTWGKRVVLYAKSGDWWVQPYANNPYTEIGSGGIWKTKVHLGSDYAALLVDKDYLPAPRAKDLPAVGKGVRAIAEARGTGSLLEDTSRFRRLEFSGYEWEVLFPASGASVDASGHLHLTLQQQGGRWVGSDVWVRRSLGYGTYVVKLRLPKRLEPATTLRMFTWDDSEAGQNHREMDIEVSQWGDPGAKNAQFVVQPYYVPANSFRFDLPEGSVEERMHWSPGRVRFDVGAPRPIASYAFSSGVPTPGAEKFHLSLGVYERARQPQRDSIEVVIEKFEFRP